MKLLLVYNPHAGHDNALKILPKVKKKLQECGIEFDIHLTDYPEHATQIVNEADFSQYDALGAAGGDGTLFEVINGYYKNQSEKRLPLAILPVGTGNAFARDLGLDELNFEKAIDLINPGRTKKIDVGKFTTHGQVYYFLNILGLGFVADVTETAHKLKLFGNFSYTLGVLWQILFKKSHRLEIEVDSEKHVMEALFTEISNTRYTSNFLMAPTAAIDDGYFDITVLKNMGRFRLLKALPTVFTGDHIHLPEVETWKATKIKVVTDVPKVLTPDGELLGITPIEVECLKQAIEVFWK
ncbi:MAG: diacylglycerol kinase family lipid kinase [Candidatus Marinimicrobia bacterium]|nr:diacylglycerol kinase family lipid kinase [Candidatus Neomarinimicrobiota bacterium]